ncbi:MAG TPA: hypothetical protein VFO34_16550 [Candidatus Acidoferrales bacterium]|nr:hypothetical protein [Candidatus Acidoferrales bacterium]
MKRVGGATGLKDSNSSGTDLGGALAAGGWADENFPMRAMISLVVTLGIGLGIYYFFLHGAAPGQGNQPITQEISTTGVEMDLNAIAQAERAHFASAGSYASLDQLISNGDLTMTRSGRDGYTYSVETTDSGFTAVAKWKPQSGEQMAAGLHYPTISVDQTMQMHRGD